MVGCPKSGWIGTINLSEVVGVGVGVEEEVQSLCKISLKLVLSEVYMS